MSSKKILEKAIIFIENNLYEPITPRNVANVVSYSYYHFHRYFHSMMGETIGVYIRFRRLTEAAKALLYTEKKILDIAVSLHFQSHEAFTRAFKNRYGVTPKQYRNNRIDTLIGNMPQLDANELVHRTSKITLTPEIIIVPSKTIIGIRFETSIANNQSIKQWGIFKKQLTKMKNVSANSDRYGFFEGNNNCEIELFNEDSLSTEFIGIEIDKTNFESNNMLIKEFSGGKYAKFIHTGTVNTLYMTYRYIWGTWFPNSNKQLDMRDDFECYTERFLGTKNDKSQIDIYFPIV
ncbi:AraC family transcriptional regulator [Clostridium estertheticum]|uniref:AraC family transcriptional regulator n=1 Tax=Clostridium estertheticum TaxID=238834 RepID=UPI001C0B50F2|nr:AraC family transcriptional regulator [Clostridium estertheticum]MBU3187482.1 AraC family transcriptional regulator [Clostridium estertheticum]